jgi:hypothetical protein
MVHHELNQTFSDRKPWQWPCVRKPPDNMPPEPLADPGAALGRAGGRAPRATSHAPTNAVGRLQHLVCNIEQTERVNPVNALLGRFLLMEARVDKFLHRHNLENFRKHLAETKDDAQRQTLSKLLAEEEAKDRPVPKDGI